MLELNSQYLQRVNKRFGAMNTRFVLDISQYKEYNDS